MFRPQFLAIFMEQASSSMDSAVYFDKFSSSLEMATNCGQNMLEQ